ncbi:MAG: hypothetical protein KAU94_03780 [Verrucomicrobia bacterium]|nr:hypothetical protein [Verrucomicrobiota bacterium]
MRLTQKEKTSIPEARLGKGFSAAGTASRASLWVSGLYTIGPLVYV